jgi:hypothetical protein
MKTTYCIISYLNNSITEEKVAIGFLVIQENNPPYLKFSPSKLQIVKRLNASAYNFLNKNIQEFVKSIEMMSRENSFVNYSSEDLTRLNIYEQGIFHFSTPRILNEEPNIEKLDFYFKKWIDNGMQEKTAHIKKDISEFKSHLENKLYIPLRKTINVNYSIKKKLIPDLIFDYKLDAIGANGSLLTAKSVDLKNAKRGSIENTVAKYEFLLDCLIPFSEKNLGLKNNHETLLIINKPDANSENEELYHKLKDQKNLDFKVIDADNIDYIQKTVAANHVSKFSSLLEKWS